MPKLYTKTGDDGTTHLIGGRASKASEQIEAIGTVDELNATLGVVLTLDVAESTRATLQRVQGELFTLGAELALGPQPGRDVPRIAEAHVAELEREIDAATAHVVPLRQFVLPGGSASAAQLHVARAVCRRAERRVVAVGQRRLQRYLNRLSDLLFALGRAETARVGTVEATWKGSGGLQ